MSRFLGPQDCLREILWKVEEASGWEFCQDVRKQEDSVDRVAFNPSSSRRSLQSISTRRETLRSLLIIQTS